MIMFCGDCKNVLDRCFVKLFNELHCPYMLSLASELEYLTYPDYTQGKYHYHYCGRRWRGINRHIEHFAIFMFRSSRGYMYIQNQNFATHIIIGKLKHLLYIRSASVSLAG